MELILSLIIILWCVFWLLDLALNSRVWWWEFFSFVPAWTILLSILMMIVFAVVLIPLSIWYLAFVIAFTPLALNRSDFNLIIRKSKQPVVQSSKFRLFNWNTEYWEWKNVAEFYEFLKAQDADVYHLQEATQTKKIDQPLSQSELDAVKAVFPDYQVFQNGELVTLSRLKVDNVFAPAGERFLRLDLNIGGKIISAYNVHLPVQVHLWDCPNWSERLKSMRLAFRDRLLHFRKLEAELRSNNNYKFISGDFNTARTISLIQPLFRRYVNSFNALKRGLPRSFVFKNKVRWWRIDWIFGEGVQFVSHTDVDTRQFSDHYGQLVEISL